MPPSPERRHAADGLPGVPSPRAPGTAAGYSLRPVRTDDAPDVLTAFSSAPDMARQGDVTDIAGARRLVDWLTAEDALSRAIVDGSDVLVGVVGVRIDAAERTGWVHYWLHAAHRGRGITSRAVATVCDALLGGDEDAEGLARLELGHRVDNPASGGVARAAGFVLEGREREKFLVGGVRVDVLTYGRLRSDPWPHALHLPDAADRPSQR